MYLVSALTLELLHDGLDGLQRIPNGSGFAFSSLSVPEKGFQDISILQQYPFLRHFSAPGNYILDASPLGKVHALTAADLSNNCLETLAGCHFCTTTPFLQLLNFASNQLTSVAGLKCPPTLTLLKLDHNKINALDGIARCCPGLRRLDVNGNQLSTLAQISDLPKLEILQVEFRKTLTRW